MEKTFINQGKFTWRIIKRMCNLDNHKTDNKIQPPFKQINQCVVSCIKSAAKNHNNM